MKPTALKARPARPDVFSGDTGLRPISCNECRHGADFEALGTFYCNQCWARMLRQGLVAGGKPATALSVTGYNEALKTLKRLGYTFNGKGWIYRGNI